MPAVSYGFNSNLAGLQDLRPIPSVSLGRIAAPSRTVMLFEVSGNVAALTEPGADEQSAWGNTVQGSAEGNPTLSDTTYPSGWSADPPGGLVLYATGNMGGVLLNGATKGGVALAGARGSDTRHGNGANYAACDGHVAWLRPGQISPGFSAEAADGPQVVGGGAAGTANPKFTLTFSSK